MWFQKTFNLKPKARGFHLITQEVISHLPECKRFQMGWAHLFILHTSASLTLNENADPDVRHDMETQLNYLIPDGSTHYTHRLEGPDDMPAHIKCSLLGTSLLLPISDGSLRLGTWQGIYLGEHRNAGGSRSLVATLQGEAF